MGSRNACSSRVALSVKNSMMRGQSSWLVQSTPSNWSLMRVCFPGSNRSHTTSPPKADSMLSRWSKRQSMLSSSHTVKSAFSRRQISLKGTCRIFPICIPTRSEIFDAEAIQTSFINKVKRAVQRRQTWFAEWDIIGNIKRDKKRPPHRPGTAGTRGTSSFFFRMPPVLPQDGFDHLRCIT